MTRREVVLGSLALVAGVLLGAALNAGQVFVVDGPISTGDLLEPLAAVLLGAFLYAAAGQLTDRHKFLLTLVVGDLQALQSLLSEVDRFFEQAAASRRSLAQTRRLLAAFHEAIVKSNQLESNVLILGFRKTAIDAAGDLALAIRAYRINCTNQGFSVASYQASRTDLARSRQHSEAVRAALMKVAHELAS